MNGSAATLLVSVVIAIITSVGAWVTLFYTRRERREKQEEWLSDAQRKLQRDVLDSANERYEALHKDYRECREGFSDLRVASNLLADVVERILYRLKPNGAETFSVTVELAEVGEIRRVINEARSRFVVGQFPPRSDGTGT